MILNLLFVLPHLLFHFVESRIKNGNHVVARLTRDKVVAMFCINENFHIGSIIGEIDRHIDCGDPVEKRQQLFRFSSDMFVGTGT